MIDGSALVLPTDDLEAISFLVQTAEEACKGLTLARRVEPHPNDDGNDKDNGNNASAGAGLERQSSEDADLVTVIEFALAQIWKRVMTLSEAAAAATRDSTTTEQKLYSRDETIREQEQMIERLEIERNSYEVEARARMTELKMLQRQSDRQLKADEEKREDQRTEGERVSSLQTRLDALHKGNESLNAQLTAEVTAREELVRAGASREKEFRVELSRLRNRMKELEAEADILRQERELAFLRGREAVTPLPGPPSELQNPPEVQPGPEALGFIALKLDRVRALQSQKPPFLSLIPCL